MTILVKEGVDPAVVWERIEAVHPEWVFKSLSPSPLDPEPKVRIYTDGRTVFVAVEEGMEGEMAGILETVKPEDTPTPKPEIALRESGRSKLKALGLTSEELEALGLGG